MIKTLHFFRKHTSIKIIAIVISYCFVCYRIMSHNGLGDAMLFFKSFYIGQTDLLLFGLVVYLMFINWGLEAYKWKILVKNIAPVTNTQSGKIIFSGISYGLIFSRGIGSMMAKLKPLPKGKMLQGATASIVGGLMQGGVTFVIGSIGLFYLSNNFAMPEIGAKAIGCFLVVICLLIFVVFFLFSKKEDYRLRYGNWLNRFRFLKEYSAREMCVLAITSLLRYAVFSIQYTIVIKIFVGSLAYGHVFACVTVIYLVMSIIPSFFLGGLGIRGSVSLFVLGYYTGETLGVLAASFVIWVINIAMPSFIGFSMSFLNEKSMTKLFSLKHVN